MVVALGCASCGRYQRANYGASRWVSHQASVVCALIDRARIVPARRSKGDGARGFARMPSAYNVPARQREGCPSPSPWSETVDKWLTRPLPRLIVGEGTEQALPFAHDPKICRNIPRSFPFIYSLWSGRGNRQEPSLVCGEGQKKSEGKWCGLREDHFAYDVRNRRLAVLRQQRVEFPVDAANRRHAFFD
jgi:hypothetical protein